MGKKSRQKKERRAINNLVSTQNGLPNMIVLDDFKKPIFRFFKQKEHAEDLCRGYVWISTLNECRQHEVHLQGDTEEATLIYKSGYIAGGSGNPAFIEMASRGGIVSGDTCANISIGSITHTQKIVDAYVLCLTKDYNPEELSDTFGHYCVKISNPMEFFKRISYSLIDKDKVEQCVMGSVKYNSREYGGLSHSPGVIGFVKPESFSIQKEFRFIWTLKPFSHVKPFLHECHEIRDLCCQIS